MPRLKSSNYYFIFQIFYRLFPQCFLNIVIYIQCGFYIRVSKHISQNADITVTFAVSCSERMPQNVI